jgi:hypothetical protein
MLRTTSAVQCPLGLQALDLLFVKAWRTADERSGSAPSAKQPECVSPHRILTRRFSLL